MTVQWIFILVRASCLIFNNPPSFLPSSKPRSAHRRLFKEKHILKFLSLFSSYCASLANKTSFIHLNECISFALDFHFSDCFQTVGIVYAANSIILKPLEYFM